MTGARLVSWLAFLLGSLASVAGNVLATQIPPAGVTDWQPSLAAQIGAGVWPLMLLLAVEVLSRVPWPQGWGWRAVAYLGVGAVALFSAVISYQHIRDLLLHWHYPTLSASVGPLVVDGLMTAAGLGLLAVSRKTEAPTRASSSEEPVTNAVTAVTPKEPQVSAKVPKPHFGSDQGERSSKTPKPQVRPKVTKPDFGGDQVKRARELIAAAEERGERMGRSRLAKEMGLSDHQARTLLEQLRTPLKLAEAG